MTGLGGENLLVCPLGLLNVTLLMEAQRIVKSHACDSCCSWLLALSTPAAYRAAEDAAAGFHVNPAAAGRTTVSLEPNASTADVQTLPVLHVVHDAAAIAYEGNCCLKQI
jgi:hypothetical protein